MRHFHFAIGLLTLALCGAADWPQFRGSQSTGVASDGKPPLKWSDKAGVAWKVSLPGPGSSSPIIVGDKVFVTCYSGYGVSAESPGEISQLKRHVVCVSRTDGKILWSKEVPAVTPEDAYRGFITDHGYASGTPASDGQSVYVYFGKSGVLAFDMKGEKLWQTSVGTGSDIRGWGSSTSVILHENLVIVNAASESRTIYALDKKTGQEVWKAKADSLSLCFSTPALVRSGEQVELVVAVPGEVWGLNPTTGKLRWFSKINSTGNVCPSVTPGDGLAYIIGGFQSKGSAAIRTGGKDDVTATNTVWSNPKSSYVPTPVLNGGKLYCVNEDGFALAWNAENGKILYEERLPSKGGGGRGSRPFYASPVLADGKLYAVSRKGGVFVLKAGNEFEILHQNPALDDSDFNATPAIVGPQLFLRSNKFLYCLQD